MPIVISCPDCAKKLKLADQHAGKKIKCPGCGGAIKVPAGEEIPELAPIEEEPEREERPRRHRKDAEEDEAPRRKKKRKAESAGPSLLPWLIGGGAGVLLIGVVVLVVILSRNSGTPGPKPPGGGPPGLTGPTGSGGAVGTLDAEAITRELQKDVNKGLAILNSWPKDPLSRITVEGVIASTRPPSGVPDEDGVVILKGAPGCCVECILSPRSPRKVGEAQIGKRAKVRGMPTGADAKELTLGNCELLEVK